MHRIFCFVLLQMISLNLLASSALNDTINLQVISSNGEPLHGTYIVNKCLHYLITTTDEKGFCKIPYPTLAAGDTIEFAYLGFTSRQFPSRELLKLKQIILIPKTQYLQEVSVKGIPPKTLLAKVSEQLKSFRPKYPLNYYGNAQYEKITECNLSTVEYRNEYGCYFTSGNVRLKEKWDLNYHFYFVPAYSARSFNFQPGVNDTLKKQIVTGGRLEYDAGNRKIFNAIRSVLLWGPLFTNSRYYDIKLLDVDSVDYIFTFVAQEKYYPNDIKIYCRGTLKIDKQTFHLKNIHFDYLDYHFYKLTNQTRPQTPFSTSMDINFAYNATGIYIQSCQQITTWKHNSDQTYGGIEKPSRRNPAKNHLIEREALRCETFQKIPQNKQEKYLLQQTNVASCNPEGEFDVQIFNSQPQLLKKTKALKELNHYQDIQSQFKHNSNRPYYTTDQIVIPLKINSLDVPVNVFIQRIKKKILHDFFIKP